MLAWTRVKPRRAVATFGALLTVLLALFGSPAVAGAAQEHRLKPIKVNKAAVVFGLPSSSGSLRRVRLLIADGRRWKTRPLRMQDVRTVHGANRRVAIRRSGTLRRLSAKSTRKRVRLAVIIITEHPKTAPLAPGATGSAGESIQPPSQPTARDEPPATYPPTTPTPTPPDELANPVVSPPAGRAGARGKLGVNAQLLWDTNAAQELAELAEAGVRWIRTDFSWAELEPTPGSFRWAKSDRLMAGAAQAGIDVLAIAAYSAPWASSDPSGHGDVLYPPSDPADYGAFVRAVLERYGPQGTFWRERPDLIPRPIKAVEIWNEPHGHWFWKPEPDIAGYARLVRVAVAAARAVAPSTTLLASGELLEYRTSGQGVWLDRLLIAAPDLVEMIDAWSIHPYSDPPSTSPWTTLVDPRYSFAGKIDLADASLRRVGSDAELWATEFGWCIGDGPCGGLTEQEQAAYLSGAVDRMMTEWSDTIDRSFVFTWNKTSSNAADWTARFGLRRPDGTRRPAWDALARYIG